VRGRAEDVIQGWHSDMVLTSSSSASLPHFCVKKGTTLPACQQCNVDERHTCVTGGQKGTGGAWYLAHKLRGSNRSWSESLSTYRSRPARPDGIFQHF
jgi:hypothetical protein